MHLKDICTVVERSDAPEELKESTIGTAKVLIKEGFDVEVIISLTSVTMDVYNDLGQLEDRVKTKFRKVNPLQ